MLCWYCIMYLLLSLVKGLLGLFDQYAAMTPHYYTGGLHLLHVGFKVVFPQKQGWISLISVKTRKAVIVKLMFHPSSSALEVLAKCSVVDGRNGLIWNWIWGGLAYTNSACQHTWPWHPSADCRFLSAGSSYLSPWCCNWISPCSLFLVSSGSFRRKPNDQERCKLIGWRDGKIWCRIKHTKCI